MSYRFIYPPTQPFNHLSTHPYTIHPSFAHSTINPSIQPFTHSSTHPPTHPSIHLCLQALPSPRCLLSARHSTFPTNGSFPLFLNTIKSLLLNNYSPSPSLPHMYFLSLLSHSREMRERMDFLSAPSPPHSHPQEKTHSATWGCMHLPNRHLQGIPAFPCLDCALSLRNPSGHHPGFKGVVVIYLPNN